ncbi:DMSO reductase anchor subunit [Aliiruegeria haliotis]|uniref:DMSO reductase anchor subunit n=1 Tax=Aliiruegeria haliotis TaxID=1280846 RepID=A0A2T0RR11_9RHOB|nr:DmsC/YnfH family molybdoenzyme membrane anchor subunit [Aliiruegeria haliotis]PRY23635.1 DMSO reductase anchor subunit [Aliiruegeria haliotis]
MHPAYSVIFFTTASGAGYGLLFWLSLATAIAPDALGRWPSLAMLAVALVFVTAGLLASTFHLGHPERAPGALSQWRSSWLSREGVAAVATYVPAGLMGLLWLLGLAEGLIVPLALLTAAGAVATVYCTGMIYASLRTIRQWNRRDVPWIYLALAAATGGILFGLLGGLAGVAGRPIPMLTLACLLVAAGLKHRYWTAIDADPGAYTAKMAIGIPGLDTLRPLDAPHTMPNFVMREMGFTVARKHAEKLRRLTWIALFAAPALLLLLGVLTGLAVPVYLLAAISAATGVVLERWLFFAEAEHVSQLYYGRSRA